MNQENRLMNRVRGLPAILVTSIALLACGSGDPAGIELPELAEFRGNYTDAGTCVDRGDGSWPITIWLYNYDVQTQAVRVAVRLGGTGGSHTNADQYRGTLTRNGALQAFAYWNDQIDEEYEIKATVTRTSIQGNVYEHCGDGTADIWNFTAVLQP